MVIETLTATTSKDNRMSSNISPEKTAIQYYDKKFGDNTQAAFIHLVREVGEIAFAMEKQNIEHAKLEITESIALLHYLASKYPNFDVLANMQGLYSKKLEGLKDKP